MRVTLKETVIWIMLAVIAGYTGFQVIRGIINSDTILEIGFLSVGLLPIISLKIYSLKKAYKEFQLYKLCNNPAVDYINSKKIETEFQEIKETRKN